ncbi:histidine kinase dimerization/phospho-acceptor domain-containing protein [Novosphingobium sp.]|uniref:histidine kinase dimerization/phospho-acceptor domain-containing protein n=1 Tax=Novosphingobium sp. TaxID=1874826 RepID=UPI002FDD593D
MARDDDPDFFEMEGPAGADADGGLAHGASSPFSTIVDDRLDTVLRTRAAGPAGLRVQFRQLADLIGRGAAGGWTRRHDEALDRLDSLHDEISAGAAGIEGAATLLAHTPLRHPRLAAHFANKAPRVALAAIRGAVLREDEWLELVPRLPIQARGFLRHRRDLGARVERLLDQLGIKDFALEAPAAQDAALPVSASALEPSTVAKPPIEAAPVAPQPIPLRIEPSPPPAEEGIGAIVRRIEAFRRDREERLAASPVLAAPPITATADPHPRLPFADEPSGHATPLSIDIAIDAGGTVVTADADWAPMLVGYRPFSGAPDAPARTDHASQRAFAGRLPIIAGKLTLDGPAALAGHWQVDAVPLFAAGTGAFTGYRGCLRRPAEAAAQVPAAPAAPADEGSDRLRQTLHELRTPINAIQGFAEMIQQQVFGAAPHQYRSLAASIAADAARMLAGFEDLERLARLEGGQGQPLAEQDAVTDLTAMVVRLIAQLEPVIGPREVRLRWIDGDGGTQAGPPAARLPVAVTAIELEHMIWRMLAVIGSAAAPGERLAIALHQGAAATARLDLPLPAALAARDDAALFAADSARSAATGGMLGNGFALRLAAAEVRAMGGRLRRDGARLRIDLPLAGEHGTAHGTGPAPLTGAAG